MSNNHPVESSAADTAEWTSAWASVSRLAVARQTALRELTTSTAGGVEEAIEADDLTDTALGAIDHGQLASAIAEIEQASAALKSVEPALEPWLPETAAAEDTRKPRSVWVLIGAIWLAMAVIAGMLGTIGYLLT